MTIPLKEDRSVYARKIGKFSNTIHIYNQVSDGQNYVYNVL